MDLFSPDKFRGKIVMKGLNSCKSTQLNVEGQTDFGLKKI